VNGFTPCEFGGKHLFYLRQQAVFITPQTPGVPVEKIDDVPAMAGIAVIGFDDIDHDDLP
jgi:hypothetical protein